MMRAIAVLLASCAVLLSAAAQTTPSVEEMVEKLAKPAATGSRPTTRGLRNLTVEAAAAPAPKPSLSLLIQFDFDSARVKPESQEALANLSQALQTTALADSRFAVEGHTDAKGAAEYNLRLSQQRAEAVRDFLKGHGVAQERLVAAGKGASELANAAEPFAAENRRVRIVNLD